MLIYLLRHGTTEWNAVHKIQGDTDTSLDDIGREMARQTGLWFKDQGITFDKVFSSPLKRAYNTAKLASDSEDIVVDERLRELGFGNMEGLVVEDMLEKDKEFPFVYFKTKPDIYDEKVKNDSEAEIREIASWIASLNDGRGREIPYHISRFFPRHRMSDRKPTKVETIYRLADVARETLKYVYTGNC